MSYLEEFAQAISDEQLSQFMRLWEEYCLADEVDGKELVKLLQLIKGSKLARPFGQLAETALPMWEQVADKATQDEVLRLVVDLQTTNSAQLAKLTLDFLKTHYGDQKHYREKLRLVGMRTKVKFQGAITNYELLTHMSKGKCVFHTGGWGVGEVMDISLLREHVVLEFEGISSLKDIPFSSAFKNLVALPPEHFLSRRFCDPDTLEQEGRDNPTALVHILLRDLGPKSAAEIKDELADLVIPEKDWTKWWQQARSKLKKDTLVQSPKSMRQPFILREEALSHEVQFLSAIKAAKTTRALITTIYNYTRDFSGLLKDLEIKNSVREKLVSALEKETNPSIQLQLSLLLEDLFPDEFSNKVASLVASAEEVETLVSNIDILAFKKKCLVALRAHRPDWVSLFLQLLFSIEQNALRDYLLRELLDNESSVEQTRQRIKELIEKVSLFPDAFFWYFQKVAAKEQLPFSDATHRPLFLEAYMIGLHYIEHNEKWRDLAKKMHNFLTANRYAVVREMIKETSADYLKELLLLVSKCMSFSKHDKKIFQSLAEVVQPSLKTKSKAKKSTSEILWTTQEGFKKIQDRVKHVATVETIDNAKEIEAARALGDLRENAEYKAALERRSRLQGELKTLSMQVQRARIISKNDVSKGEVGIGAVVTIALPDATQKTYTLLGPWDAEPEKNILALESKLAQAMIGLKEGESFDFQGKHYEIISFKSIFD